MTNFLKLIYNEQFKIYIKKSTWIMYIILAVLIIAFAFLLKNMESEETSNENWREKLQTENEQLSKEIEEANRDTDQFIIENNMYIIEKNSYHLENDIPPLGQGAWAFTSLSKDFLGLVAMFTIIIAASIVANEFSQGTIKLLLIRPIHRSTILLSKYISVLIFAFMTAIFTFIVAFLVGSLFFGVEGANPLIVVEKNGGFTHTSVIVDTFSNYGFSLIELIILATFAFMISAIFRNNSLSIGLALFLFFSGNTIVVFFKDYEWAKYILFANTDLQQYFAGTPFIEGMTLSFSITVLLVYYVIFIALAWIFFTKRDVAGT